MSEVPLQASYTTLPRGRNKRIFVELITSDRKLQASIEVSN